MHQTAHESPSASSIFLPLGRRTPQTTKSSPSTEFNHDALHEALNNIHTAASQSQDLTVFNEYTSPPAASPEVQSKGLAGDLQGGLTGLYHKLKATVGGTREVVDSPVSDTFSHDKTTSQPASNLPSRIQSPRLLASNPSAAPDVGSAIPKPHSKSSSLSKPPGPLTTSLKSPTSNPHQLLYADPSLTEVNVHATASQKPHSRNGSSYDGDETTHHEHSLMNSAEEQSLRKVLSRGEIDSKTVWHDRRLLSPKLSPITLVDNRPAIATYERGLHEHSIAGQLSKNTTANLTVSLPSHLEEKATSRTTSGRQESTIDHKPHINSLQLLADHALSNPGSPSIPEKPKLNEKSLQPADGNSMSKLQSRVSQSRLPGFHLSRASSTDSGPITALAGSRKSGPGSALDGPSGETIPVRQHRPPHKLRNRLLGKEFWMRDDNARDCFRCGEPFTTFRRKHHCRTCGQIFDNKCTTVIEGPIFGTPGAVRVCKPCEAIIMNHDEDSSDYSVDEGPAPESANRPRTPEPSHALARYDDDNISMVSQTLEQMSRTPTMSLPVRRAYDGDGRTSAILEFDTTDRILPRPSSSRSLRTAHNIGHGHKRHHSKHQHIRSFKAYHEDRAPFQRRTLEDLKDDKQSAFHRDSIIDPDLAQYLSDDASSGEDPALDDDQSSDKVSRQSPDHERTTIGGLLAAVRKGRSRMGDRSIAGFLNLGRDAEDAASIVSSRAIEGTRHGRKRNLSVVSTGQHRLTPKSTKERLHVVIPGKIEPEYIQTPSYPPARVSRMIRSASMHGIGAPSLELNRASLHHVQKLLKQLLKDAGVSKVSSWEDALLPILLRATDDVDPDVPGGDDIDIRNYVKLKKIPGGKPGDTSYISGLIFTKNVALKSMSRCLMNPRILIITFALEYARHEQHFMSLDPVIRQEREYLENIVSRIAALKPDVLLAQRNVSGLALELLDKAGIATVYNVKIAVLEAVSRCTQARIAHSMDKLTLLSDQLGTCDIFEVKTYVAEGRRKTYINISGCPPHLGCTIALRGADSKMLAKVKRITDFMIYVVYNLKLETCLMRDEWALIPSQLNETNPKANDTKNVQNQEHSDLSMKTVSSTIKAPKGDQASRPDVEVSNADLLEVKEDQPSRTSKRLNSQTSDDIPDDIPVPTFYEDLVDKHQTKILSASPFVKFVQPYLLMRARELERRVVYLKRLRDQELSSEVGTDEKVKAQKFTLIQPDMVHTSLEGASKKVREIIHAVHDSEYDKALHNYETQKKQWEAYLSGNRNLFDPYAHQNIVVLFSQVSTTTNVPCSGPDLLAFGFYNEHEHDEEFEADCTLGQFVEDLVYRANDVCSSEACERKLYEHHRQYVHGEAQITVFVQPHPPKMRGLQDVILMWSQCKICGVETTVTPMSLSTWKYSFGKYLELSFWSADLHARAGVCPHDLHRDHLRYFGYKDFALRVHYDPIELLEIIVPRMRITWKVDTDLRFRNEAFTRIEQRITRFMVSVKLRLKSINVDALLPESAEPCRAEIEALTKKANEDHTMLIKQLQERYTCSRHWETIPLNRAIRALQEKVADWDTAFTDFEKNYFPSEKDIRRLATLQLKKIFLDRDVSVTSLSTGDDAAGTPSLEEGTDEKGAQKEDATLAGTPQLSPEKTQSVLESVLEEHASNEKKIEPATEKSDPEKVVPLELPEVPGERGKIEDVQHLDLAVPPVILTEQNDTSMARGVTQPPESTQENPDEAVVDDDEINEADESTPVAEVPQHLLMGGNQNARYSTPLELNHADRLLANHRQEALGLPNTPMLTRTHSQPTGSVAVRNDHNRGRPGTLSTLNALNGFGSAADRTSSSGKQSESDGPSETGETRLSQRLGLAHLKKTKFVKGQSFIPRAITNRKESRVSNLAKHFEQLSREFERERVREKKLRAAKSRQSRVYPLAASKPIVEVYKDVDEAVDGNDGSDDIFHHADLDPEVVGETAKTAEGMAETDPMKNNGEGFHIEETPAEMTENDTEIQQSSHAPSEVEDHSEADDISEEIHLPDSPEDLLRLSHDDSDLKDLGKHERSSLMKMLTNFWAERSSSGWAPLEYPFGSADHIFADCDIVVREDEPSSIIAFALDSQDYLGMLHDIQDQPPINQPTRSNPTRNESVEMQADVMHSLLRKTGSHFRYQFQEGPAKMLCKIFFAEQFDAMRRKCGVADRFVESLSRCLKFDSKGGKSKSLFLKTLDDRFVLKSLSPVETTSFLKFAPNYFQIMSEAFFHELPSVIAKMLGFYQVVIKNPVTGVEYNWFLLVMENLFYDRTLERIFDLKGSMRNRKINATGESNEVLLDENMVEFIYESPLFAREHSKKLLRSSVHNDTLFLARQNVMDYSLMIAIDENRKELVVGIIDCIRTYTWDKKFESWIKDRGLGGGGKNRPTVTSPKEYKRRFREAMGRYVLEAPNCWHQFKPVKTEKRILKLDGDGDKGETELQVLS